MLMGNSQMESLEEWQASDVGCPDTFAPSYTAFAASEAGAVAALAERKKCEKYCHLDTCHTFVPVAIDALRLNEVYLSLQLHVPIFAFIVAL